MDPIILLSFFLFGIYVVSRRMIRLRAVSSVPWFVGDSAHFGLGLFVSRLDLGWAVLVSVLYLVYEVFDYVVSRDTAGKDVAVYLGGLVSGLGYGLVVT